MLFVQGNLWDKARIEWPDIPYPQTEGAPTTPSKDTPKYSKEEMDSLLKITPPVYKADLKTWCGSLQSLQRVECQVHPPDHIFQ